MLNCTVYIEQLNFICSCATFNKGGIAKNESYRTWQSNYAEHLELDKVIT